MANAENLDFLNANSLRNFPIKEGLSKLSIDGVLTLPDDFIVDLVLAASSDVTARFYISKVSNLPNVVVVELSSIAGTTSLVCGTFTIETSTHTLNKTYYLLPSDNYPASNGKLTVASVATIGGLPLGVFSFEAATTELESRVIIPSLNNITKFTFSNADGSTFSVTGDITIVAGINVSFRGSGSTIYVDAGEGLGLNLALNDPRVNIKTINGVPPDDEGNFVIETSNCAQLQEITNGLLLNDTCCKPCLSCDEIGDLTGRLMQLETDMLNLRDHYQRISTLSSQLTISSNSSCACA